MTESSWPFDNQDTSETQYSELVRRLQRGGIYGDTTTSDLKVFADSSGMQVKLNPGYAIIRGHMYWNDTLKIIPIDAAGAQARVDQVILRLDPAQNSIVAVMLDGPAGGTSGAALTQTDSGIWEELLANVAVSANASTIAAGNVTDRRRFAGFGFGIWETPNRPATPRKGEAGFNLTLGYNEQWNGSSWVSMAPTSFPATALTGTIANGQFPTRLQENSWGSQVTDWNNAQLTGWYTSSTGSSNSPNSGNAWFGQVIRGDTNNLVQQLFQVGSGPTVVSSYTRLRNADGSWTAWFRSGVTSSEAAAVANLINGVYAKSADVTSLLAGKIGTGDNTVAQHNLPFRTAGGRQQMVPAGSSAPYTKITHVTFPAGRFTAAPIVVCGINTTADTDSFVGAQNVTVSGFDLFFKRDSKTSTETYWFAYDSVNS